MKKGFPAVIHSGRDLGKDGYRGCSPWARQGIFIFTQDRVGQSESTRESKSPRPAQENKWLHTPHEFTEWGSPVCGLCVMVKEGHDRLMKRLAGEKVEHAPLVQG